MESKFTVLILVVFCIYAVPDLMAQQDFEQWKKSQQQEFQQFQDARDKEFMNYLEREWKEFQTFQGIVRDDTPKPQDIPTAKTEPKKVPEKPDAPKVSPPATPPSTPPKVTPSPSVSPKPPEHPEKYQEIQFHFFGTLIKMQYDKAIHTPVSQTITNETISEFWKSLGTADNKHLVDQAQDYRKQLGLNDWGYAVFAHHLGENIYGDSQNSAGLFTWFILLKSGYEARVGFNENTVYLLLPSENTLYSIPYLTVDETKFYIVPLGADSKKVKGITSYNGDYPGDARRVDFRLPNAPQIARNVIDKTMTFAYLNEEYTVSVKLNKNAADFYDTYPQTDIPVYFGSSLSPETAESLLDGLRPVVTGKSETRAVNLLLRFVQTAFAYQTDDEQFGKENYLFPEETLYYPASDCEDRSALFAYLVRNLLGLEVIGLDYPGHIATAVKFSSDVGRDSITHDGKTYTICDPTYIKAEYGMTMPIVQDKKVTVFTFD